MFEYVIGDKAYVQKPLVMGQYRQLMGILETVELPDIGGLSSVGLITALKDKIHLAMAIILTEKGTNPKDKNIEAIATDIEFYMDVELMFKVIEDFFDCNDLGLILKKLNGVVQKIVGKLEKSAEEIATPSQTL